MIISISGFIGSGKDTVADYLVTEYGFKRESFANSLKDAVASIFSWDREMLEGRTAESRAWREAPDVWWTTRLGKTVTPRMVLQQWGTEVIRTSFHDDMWIASLERRLLNTDDDIVITDCRFPNELATLKNVGAHLVRVDRGPEPEWYEIAVLSAETGHDHMTPAYPEVHSSEYSWITGDFDAVVDNNGTLEDLYSNIRDLAQGLQAPIQHRDLQLQ
jgi:hypothetical protein